MTFNQFLNGLSKLPMEGWKARLSPVNIIHEEFCCRIQLKAPGDRKYCHTPVTALHKVRTRTGKHYQSGDSHPAAKALGLHHGVKDSIFDTCEFLYPHTKMNKVRRRLILRALGLKEMKYNSETFTFSNER